MNFVKKTVRAALTLALAASVAVPLGLSSSALNYTIDPKDRYSGTPDSVTIPALDDSKRSTIYYGDINYDSAITANDALMTLQASVGTRQLTEYQTARANVDGSKDDNDKDTVTVTDALQTLQRSVRLPVVFGAEKAVVDQALNLKIKLKCHEDGTFKVLHVSDFQDNCAAGQVIKDGTVQRFNAMIDEADPDLVVITGDNIWPCPLETEDQFRAYVDKMVAKLENEGIPWAITYGNHDNDMGDFDQVRTDVRKWRQQEIYETYPHCVATAGPDGVFGIGNYVLPILTNDESSIAFNVWCIDTGDYNQNLNTDGLYYDYKNQDLINKGYYTSYDPGSKYDFVKYDQQLWYYNTSMIMENYNGAKIPGAFFAHVCLPEHQLVDAHKDDPEVNFKGINKEGFATGPVNSHMFDTMKQRGDITGFYVGHDHINNSSGMWQGIELGFAGALTTDMYGSYNAAGNPVEVSPETQGGRIFTIKQGENGNPATVSNEWVAYDWIRDTNGSDKTTEIGEGPFDGEVIAIEAGKSIQKRVSGYDETPFDKSAASNAIVSVNSNRGYNRSAGLSIYKGGKVTAPDDKGRIDNTALAISLDNPQTLGKTRYLRVWVDFSKIDFRAASFGLVAEDGTIYSTDNKNEAGTYFYYLAEGQESWKTLRNGGDGCFGTSQGISVKDFKGWLAFPVSDFVSAGENSTAISSDTVVKEMFMFFDYSDVSMQGKGFYLDEIGLVSQFWNF